MSDSTYTPLPSSDDEKHAPSTAPLSEKPSLHRNSTEDALLRPSVTTAQQQAGTTRKAALKAALLTTAVLAIGGAGTVGLFCSPDDAGAAWRELKTSVRQGCGFGGQGQQEGQERLVKRGRGEWAWWKRDGGGEGPSGVEEFSTSTFKDGRTSTFVKTTRPIVNPGGFTIGTLTGYVPTLINGTTVGGPTSSPTSSRISSPTATSSPSAISSAASDTSSSDGESFTRETSSLPPSFAASASASSTDWYAAPTSSPSSSGSEGEEETVFVTETTTITQPASTSTATTTITQTETITAAPSSSSFSAAGARLVRRAEVEEDAQEEGGEEQDGQEEETTGKEEFSTSVNRKGDVTYTLVKTTRPIVNAGGYTIGTLDGAWVDVAKQTDRPQPPSSSSDLSSASSSTPAPAPTAAPGAEKRAQHQHEELRKREENA